MPNTIYQTGEHSYYYVTNEDSLIVEVLAEDIVFKTHPGRNPHAKSTPGKQEGDHAGHLIADRFGGSGKLDNLVSQAAVVNLSTYKKVENSWANAKREGKQVSVDISVNYDPGNTRPSSFSITYTIDGIQKILKIINN